MCWMLQDAVVNHHKKEMTLFRLCVGLKRNCEIAEEMAEIQGLMGLKKKRTKSIPQQ